ncbi:translation initiation factor if-2 [Curvularia clavata]|uniref:Translation initiation factor if-2 n=1 Tax=Curvularia clavata TaxID=95742 RepID=A0A9Q8Z1I2_CURCL|nr:translation initiation factor if-2 [Curvularia clavata]
MGVEGIFTIEPKNIQAILATQFKDFGLGKVRNRNFSPLLGHGIFSTDGEQWANARSLLRPQFARDQVSDLELEEQHVQHMIQVIPKNSDGWTDVVDVEPLFFRLTIDSATEFLFGESVDSQLSVLPNYKSNRAPVAVNEQEFAFAFDKAQGVIATAARFGDASWLIYNKESKRYITSCHAFIDHYVQLALSKQKNTTEKTSSGKEKYVFLDALVESTRDPIELRSHLISILLAGRDTTASLLSYVFMSFAQHPDVYRKLRSVVIETFGTYSHPKNLTFEALKSCNYLQWVLNEALRLYPVVPVDGRRALRDTTLPTGGGPDGTAPIYVKKDTAVDYSVYVMHRRKDFWGADAEEFRPERWDGRKSGWEYLPFNGGPRICIGQQFALTEAGYTIVRLTQKFEKIESAGNTWDEKSGTGYIRHNLSLTTCPADGVKLRMKEASE